MKDWKIARERKVAGILIKPVITASDFNSAYNESENVVTPFMSLDESDNKQLIKSIDILSKNILYKDTGTTNVIQLVRVENVNIPEILFDGISFLFIANSTNTGNTTLQLSSLPPKGTHVYGSGNVPVDYIQKDHIYIATFSVTLDSFELYDLSGDGGEHGNPNIRFRVANGISPNDMVTLGQLNNYFDKSDIVTSSTISSTTRPASANNGRVLKDYIDSVNVLLTSNDSYLDDLEEISTFIQYTRDDINSLSIADIANLQATLDAKASTSHNHNDRYYTKTETNTKLNGKANKGGSTTHVFNVAYPVDDNDAVPYTLFNDVVTNGVTGFKFVHSANPVAGYYADAEVRDMWLNKVTGEMFVCIYVSNSSSKWRGTNGTVIGY